jgi:mannose-6-phosphate isomerase-like protein (cupin superfamily)
MNGYRAGQSDRRPWGSWTVIAAGPRFAAKEITVRPGASLSLQRHRWRDEHWIVVQGVAEVTLGDATRSLAENGALFIPAGALHRLANKGPDELVIVEIQYGDRLEESDIERFEDLYGRS